MNLKKISSRQNAANKARGVAVAVAGGSKRTRRCVRKCKNTRCKKRCRNTRRRRQRGGIIL
jgi:hypothetical protein